MWIFKTNGKKTSDTALQAEQASTTISCSWKDMFTAYRLRRRWSSLLFQHFLLEEGEDYCFSVSQVGEDWVLSAAFTSPSGRYAFWRVANRHNPALNREMTSWEETQVGLGVGIFSRLGMSPVGAPLCESPVEDEIARTTEGNAISNVVPLRAR